MIESHRGHAKIAPGHEKGQGGKGSQWKRARIDCEQEPRQEDRIERRHEEKIRHGAGQYFAREQVCREQKSTAAGAAWAAQSSGQIQAAKAPTKAEEGPHKKLSLS
eukprot:2864677-Pyramimonas_sp.AAC.1